MRPLLRKAEAVGSLSQGAVEVGEVAADELNAVPRSGEVIHQRRNGKGSVGRQFKTSADYFMPQSYLDEIVCQTLPRHPDAYTERRLAEKDLIYKHDPLMPSCIIELWVHKAY